MSTFLGLTDTAVRPSWIVMDEPEVSHSHEAVEAMARMVGWVDATEGAPFAPELYFANVEDMADYTLGYLRVQSGNPYALDWWATYVQANPINPPDVDYTEPHIQ